MANETRSEIRTEIRRDLRDPDAKTWSNDEINDLINAGIDAVSDFSPVEGTEDYQFTMPNEPGQNFGVSLSFAPTQSFTNIFRVDVLNSENRFYETLPVYTGGWGNGWQWFAGQVHIPASYQYPTYNVTVGETEQERVILKIWGYKRHALLESDGTASDLSDNEKNAVRIFAQAEALQRLMVDRANFQQWQVASGSSDMTISELSVLASAARTRWRMEIQRLRRLRQLA